jgi:hypothetical protein
LLAALCRIRAASFVGQVESGTQGSAHYPGGHPMHYFALLLTHETDPQTTPPDAEAAAEVMAAYKAFHARAGSAIVAGDALAPSALGARITGGPAAPTVTDGPFAEGAEIANGYYILEAANLDDALALARDIPAASYGAVEVWPMVQEGRPEFGTLTGDSWIALLLEPPGNTPAPGTPEWDEGVKPHIEFGKAAGDRLAGGAPLHPPSTATTVKVRNGEVLLTDGPYIEGAEVANGFYFINTPDRDEAVKIASMIPATTVELRRLAGISAL